MHSSRIRNVRLRGAVCPSGGVSGQEGCLPARGGACPVECLPRGCLPRVSACQGVSGWWMSAQGVSACQGVSGWLMSAQGVSACQGVCGWVDVCPGCCLPARGCLPVRWVVCLPLPLPVDRMTDMCKNITLATTTLRTVIIKG